MRDFERKFDPSPLLEPETPANDVDAAPLANPAAADQTANERWILPQADGDSKKDSLLLGTTLTLGVGVTMTLRRLCLFTGPAMGHCLTGVSALIGGVPQPEKAIVYY